MTPLTHKQERFVYEYLIDQNASAAARRAGYSPHSASSVASELMNTPHVRERVEQALRDMLAEIKCTAMALIRERMRAAFFRARRLFKGNELRTFDELDDETYDALFINYELRESGPIIRVRQPNREQALRALERVHERLERLQDARCMHGSKAIMDEEASAEVAEPSASVSTPAPANIVLDLARLACIETGPAPVSAEPAPPASPASSTSTDAPEHEITPGTHVPLDVAAATPMLDEKTQVFSGSTPPNVPAAPAQARLSPFSSVLAAFRALKDPAASDTKPGGRDDPNPFGGGTRPPTPSPNPAPP